MWCIRLGEPPRPLGFKKLSIQTFVFLLIHQLQHGLALNRLLTIQGKQDLIFCIEDAFIFVVTFFQT